MPRKLLLLFVMLLNCLSLQAQDLSGGVLFVGVKNGSSDIYLWQDVPVGDSLLNITSSPQKEGNACWWNRHSVILASREISPDHYALIAVNAAGETIWTLEDPVGSLGWPVPSPWDDRILCVRGFSNGFVQTGVVNFPDGSFEPLEFEGLSGGQLAWLAPDKILLSRVTAGGFCLHLRDLDTGKEVELVSGGNNWQSHINSSTGRMFFVRRSGQTGSIFELVNNNGQWEYDNLTHARTYDWQPSTDLAGETLIYRSLRDGRFSTVVRDLHSGNEKVLGIEGFSQIYFPVIVEKDVCALFNN